MKTSVITLVLGLGLASMLSAQAPAAKTQKAVPAGEKLFQCSFNQALMQGKDRWIVTRHVFWNAKVPNSEQILKTVQPKAEKEYFHLVVGKEAVNFMDPTGKRKYEVECGLTRKFPLRPDMAGKTLEVSIRYTGKGLLQLYVNCDGKGFFRGTDPKRTGNIQTSFKIPAGAKSAAVNFWLRGEGDIKVLSGSAFIR